VADNPGTGPSSSLFTEDDIASAPEGFGAEDVDPSAADSDARPDDSDSADDVPRAVPTLCAAGVTLRDQINQRWPERDKASDGWIGDASHQARAGFGLDGKGSFHNPDPNGVVHAIDVDENLTSQDSDKACSRLARQLAAYCKEGLDGGRIAHIVYEDKCASPSRGWEFTGENFGHTFHMHVSFTEKADGHGKPFRLPIFDPGAWDGHVPPLEKVLEAQASGEATAAAWRVACRLHDLGFLDATPEPRRTQVYPAQAVMALQESLGADPTGRWSAEIQARVFGFALPD
jgi:hypothetical protein